MVQALPERNCCICALKRCIRSEAPHPQSALTLYRSAGSQSAAFATFWDADIFVAAGAIDEGLADLARATLGDADRGLERLQKIAEADAMSIFYKDQPVWRLVRSDSRFEAALTRMRTPD